MKISLYSFTFLFIISSLTIAQIRTGSTADYLVAQPAADRNVFFDITAQGVSKPIIWGLDLAWLSRDNVVRGMAFMGADKVDIIRSSFTPTDSLINGNLKTTELGRLNQRLNIISLLPSKTAVMLNCDHPSVHTWYKGRPERWAQLIDVTTRLHQERGRRVISVAPFNEPDYTATGQGNLTDFYNIAGELRKIRRFDTIRISGGNTLNCDQALNWYNQLKDRLNEGNTHQLAGSFDNYANFYQTVRANGHHATNDELHNVMEAMVGVEYGLQTGIWWGTAEYARGEFVKASYGKRLAYAEHRSNWTAASVYRTPEGKVQAFGGTSERQAVTTTYRFFSKDRDLYFDGYGPQREYIMTLPGGTGYQTGQSNAERVVNITWGDDIQPVIDGRYVLVNRNSGKVMEVASGSANAGANVRQNDYSNQTYQQWYVQPVDARIGGDFSYFTIVAVHSGKAIDVLNWSLDNGGNIIVWDKAFGGNQQWYLEYAGDGWFYIRSRHSAKCLEVANASTLALANIQQNQVNGGYNQMWRFQPIDAPIEFNPPTYPKQLRTTPQATSVRLDWDAAQEPDVAEYTIFRADSEDGPLNTIGRKVKSNSFVDNSVEKGKTYYYTVKAVDKSLNSSTFANRVSGRAEGSTDMIAYLGFDADTSDSTRHLNHAAGNSTITFVEGNKGGAVSLNGTNAFLQLPYNIANHEEITVATWIYFRGASAWQRIFDFGNDQNEYMYLTPRTNVAQMRFAIKKDGVEQALTAPSIPYFKWTHIAVTMGTSGVRLYINGVQAAESKMITIRPSDFKPILNYIGRSQNSTNPLLSAYLDDFRIYNYELSAENIAKIAGVFSSVDNIKLNNVLTVWPTPASDVLRINYNGYVNGANAEIILCSLNGKQILRQKADVGSNTVMNISSLPDGVYLLRFINQSETYTTKVVIAR
jgi:hypothetical protein